MSRGYRREALALALALALAVGAPLGLALAGSPGFVASACSALDPQCPAPPAPTPTGSCTVVGGVSHVCTGGDPASNVVDYPGTFSQGSPGSTPGPVACLGYSYSDSTTLLSLGAHLGVFNPATPIDGQLVWGQAPGRATVNARPGHVDVPLSTGTVSLADYLVVADYYQAVKLIPGKPAVKAKPASAGPPPVAAVPAQPAVPAKCVNTGGAQFLGLHAIPVCPQAGATLCGPPSTSTPQVQDMYNYLVDTYLSGKLAGGQVTTTPAADALVGLPTNASLKGANLPLSETVSDTQISTNTWKGRALVLTLTVNLSLEGVQWNWGDGMTTFAAGPGATGTPGMGSSVTHTYYDVSVHGERPTPYPVITTKDQIPVTAYGVEHLTASLSWIYPWGSVGSENLNPLTMYVPAVGAGVSSILKAPPSQATLQAHAAWIVIGQVESIPVCPTPTNCS